MIRLKYPVIVEGKYDKMKLRGMVEGEIITTEGFRIFRDKDKLTLIRRLAAAGKVVLLTDSDGRDSASGDICRGPSRRSGSFRYTSRRSWERNGARPLPRRKALWG